MSVTKKDVELFCSTCSFFKTVYDYFDFLYSKNETRLRLLEETGGFFFADIQYVLLEYLYVQIYKITDSAQTRIKGEVRDNLTVAFFAENGDFGPDQAELELLSKSIHDFRKNIVSARNRRAAHFDRISAVENLNLGKFAYGEFDTFLDNLQRFLNIIHNRYVGGPYDLGTFMDAQRLVQALKNSEYFREMCQNGFTNECFLAEETSEFKDA